MRSVINVTLLPLYPQKREPLPLLRRMGGPQGRSGWSEESLSPHIGIRSPDHATCSESPYRLSCRGLRLQKELNCIVFSDSSFIIFFPWIRILSSPEKRERGTEACACLVVKPGRKGTLRRPRCKWEYNIKMMWTEFIWLWIWTGYELLQTR
jgi:hypothetical protein